MRKIKLIRKIILEPFLFTTALYANGYETNTLIQQKEESLVKSIIPSTKVKKVLRSQIDGLYKAYLKNGQILYINPFKRLIFVGEIYTLGGKSLTSNDRNKWQNELKSKQLLKLKKDELVKNAFKVKYGKGSNKYEFIMFTDPECPYCKKAQNYFQKHDVLLYINLFPLPFHKNAKKYSLEILSSKNSQKAMDEIEANSKELKVKITPQAKKRLEKMQALGKKIQVNGTPKIFVVEKNSNKVVDVIDGANISKIDRFLKKDKNDNKK